jgi:broad specificity phosphatase PhoE
MSTPATLLLVRHGQTSWNIQRRVLGRTDIPLDDTGRAQARDLREVIGPVDVVWTSPLSRARETAALAFPAHTPRLHDDLTEMHQGDLEGLGADELMSRFGDLLGRWTADPGAVRLPGGETMAELQERALVALDSIAAATPGCRVAVVTHQLVLSVICCHLLATPTAAWRAHSHRNTAWTEVRWARPPVVVAARLSPHLPAA